MITVLLPLNFIIDKP